ncbi:MAG: hypothetical protein ACKVQJ_05985 [Pyrinomonadaceae bacterium]
MIRELITRFQRSMSERIIPSRREHTAPIKVWFDADMNTERSREAARAACVIGETVDISRTGIAFLVPAIRVKDKYLAGHERKLNVEIDLPTGKIFMRVMGRRYEKVGQHISTERFLVGAHILELYGADRENYETFLREGANKPKTAAAKMELGID